MNREQLLALFAPKVIAATVSPFGDLRIQQLTEGQVSKIRAESNKDNPAFCRRLVVASLIDENGAQILLDADLPALEAGAFGPVDTLVGAVLKAQGIGMAETTAKN